MLFVHPLSLFGSLFKVDIVSFSWGTRVVCFASTRNKVMCWLTLYLQWPNLSYQLDNLKKKKKSSKHFEANFHSSYTTWPTFTLSLLNCTALFDLGWTILRLFFLPYSLILNQSQCCLRKNWTNLMPQITFQSVKQQI